VAHPGSRKRPKLPFLAGEKLEFNHRDYAKAIEHSVPSQTRQIQHCVPGHNSASAGTSEIWDTSQPCHLLPMTNWPVLMVFPIAGVPAGLAAVRRGASCSRKWAGRKILGEKPAPLLEISLNGPIPAQPAGFPACTPNRIAGGFNRSDIAEPDRLALSAASGMLWQENGTRRVSGGGFHCNR